MSPASESAASTSTSSTCSPCTNSTKLIVPFLFRSMASATSARCSWVSGSPLDSSTSCTPSTSQSPCISSAVSMKPLLSVSSSLKRVTRPSVPELAATTVRPISRMTSKIMRCSGVVPVSQPKSCTCLNMDASFVKTCFVGIFSPSAESCLVAVCMEVARAILLPLKRREPGAQLARPQQVLAEIVVRGRKIAWSTDSICNSLMLTWSFRNALDISSTVTKPSPSTSKSDMDSSRLASIWSSDLKAPATAFILKDM
mmetsp:Transcript_63558/g.175791  ORF Transcript_63558/g.175791 Transcript_63558/m.175791 type:complete len:256 (-) Transcript_63558:498-1265(-)